MLKKGVFVIHSTDATPTALKPCQRGPPHPLLVFRLVASTSSAHPLNRNDHFTANHSVTSSALPSNASAHTMFSTLFDPMRHLKRVSNTPEHSSCLLHSELAATLIRLSRLGNELSQGECGVPIGSGVGASGGITASSIDTGGFCSANVE